MSAGIISSSPTRSRGGCRPSDAHYAAHLAEVNETREVVASEDIFGARNVLIAKKGTRIDARTARKICQHRLRAPLEESVSVEGRLDGPGLVDEIEALVAKFPDLAAAHRALNIAPELRKHATAADLPPQIAQKLTVMSVQQTQRMNQSLFCGWFSMLLARELGLPPPQRWLVGLAGFCRDVGLLHIDPAILDKTGRLTPEEWQTLQSHVVIGQIFLQDIAAQPATVVRAVLEHHERYDGSGYPAGKRGAQLDVAGQIVGMADSLASIRLKKFAASGNNLRDTMAFVQLNQGCFRPDVYSGTISVLLKSGLKPSDQNRFDTEAELLACLLGRTMVVRAVVEAIETIPTLRSRKPASTAKAELLNHTVRQARFLVKASGLAEEGTIEWLQAVQAGRQAVALAELCEFQLQQEELLWQLEKIRKGLTEFVAIEEIGLDDPVAAVVDHITETFEKHNTPAAGRCAFPRFETAPPAAEPRVC